MAKIVWLDLETSGKDPRQCGILEIGAIMEIDGEKVDTFQAFVRPDDFLIIDAEALAVNGIEREDIAAFPEERLVLASFQAWLSKYINKYDRADKALIGGFNVHFDIDFLMAFWNRQGDKYFGSWFMYHPVDLRAFAAYELRDRWASLPNGKLMTVTRAILGDARVEAILSAEGKAHSALADVTAAREAFNVIMRER